MESTVNAGPSTSNNDDNNHDHYLCLSCHDIINDDQTSSIQCISCEKWSHLTCTMTKEIFDMLAKSQKKKKSPVKVGMVAYICELCITSLKTKNSTRTQSENPTQTGDSLPSPASNNVAAKLTEEQAIQKAVDAEHSQ